MNKTQTTSSSPSTPRGLEELVAKGLVQAPSAPRTRLTTLAAISTPMPLSSKELLDADRGD